MGNVFSVSQVNSYIKQMFKEDFALRDITIKGEVSNCKYHSSGHIYFTLKEENAVMSCVMFAGYRRGLEFTLKEGQQVTANGSVEVYERDGKYQLYAKSIKLSGDGDLYRRFELLKKELMEMGMFDKAYKKPIPKYATNIGIVTASTGAAIRDIENVSLRRNSHANLYLYSAIVQGEEAADSIVDGLMTLDKMNLDVIIVGRGGGSIEDLWAFNEEKVARAIFACNTPVISAVGHETDTTIADYVSDLRAPTPSAAAEIAVFDYNSFLMEVEGINRALLKEINSKYINSKNMLDKLMVMLDNKSPKNIIKQKQNELENIKLKLSNNMNNKLDVYKNTLSILAEKLNGRSPLLRLESGYSLCSSKGKVVKEIKSVNIDDDINIDLIDGRITAKVTNKEKVKRC